MPQVDDIPPDPMGPLAWGPCLLCGGKARQLQPGRKGGFPVYCETCASIPRTPAIGAVAERFAEKHTRRERLYNAPKR